MALANRSDNRCRAGSQAQPFLPSLPVVRRHATELKSLTIVAIGSSTTEGAGITAADRSYPAVLESELRRRFPDLQIAVHNKGIGGQSALEMFQRFDSDVLSLKPSLVVWQTVVNDAVRDVGEQKLAKLLRRGIDQLKEQGSDVVLMDLQWFPREDRYPKYESYRAMQQQVAREKGVSVFPRYEAMKGWLRSNNFLPEEVLGTDGFHMADAGYRCLAIRLADGIAAELSGQAPP